MDILEQVAIGLVPIIIGVIAGRSWERTKLLRKCGHFRALLRPYDRVQIIVPNVEITRFAYAKLGTDRVQIQVPKNILYMPMPEGRAIAELTSLLHKVNPELKVQLIVAASHDPSLPTLSVGGPSVNVFTDKVLAQEFPEFSIDYPATTRAKFENHIFETVRDSESRLIRDHGFVFVTRTSRSAPCIVFCGVRAFGTAMAVELLRELPARSEAAQLIRKGRKAFIAADGVIEGLTESCVRLCFCREMPHAS